MILHNWFFYILEPLLLIIALSTDAFVASFSYGTNKIKIPFSSVIIINIVCTVMLAISLFFGSILRPYLPEKLIKIICFIILTILGIIKLFDSSIKALIRKHKNIHKKISFSALHLKFILNVYANPEEADKDLSHTLSASEAVSLALALSLDGLAVGFGAALANINCFVAIIFSFILGMLLVMLGCFIGNKLAEKISFDLSWLSGILLIILAILKL